MIRFNIFVSGEKKPDWMSRKIMKRFGTNYSHIGMIVRLYGGKTTIYHSVGKGFSKIDKYEELKKFFGEHNVREIEVTQYIKNQHYALGYLNGRIGVEYSFSQYLGFVFPGLQKFVRNGKEKGICSEETARFLNQCCNHEIKVDPSKFDFVSPKDVWEKLKHLRGL